MSSAFDFGTLAAAYDAWFQTPRGMAYDRLERRAVLRRLPTPVPGASLLDVGCGTGHWSANFAERGFDVTGVDLASEMIEVARRKDIPRTHFEVADAEALPFEAGRFDVTVAITSLEFVRDAEAVLREMVRCTARGGGVVLVAALNAWAPLNLERKASKRAPYADARFFTPPELRALLLPFGEPDVKVAAFVPRRDLLLPLSGVLEVAGRLLGRKDGAFLVGAVTIT